jgi:hypothetical protein
MERRAAAGDPEAQLWLEVWRFQNEGEDIVLREWDYGQRTTAVGWQRRDQKIVLSLYPPHSASGAPGGVEGEPWVYELERIVTFHDRRHANRGLFTSRWIRQWYGAWKPDEFLENYLQPKWNIHGEEILPDFRGAAEHLRKVMRLLRHPRQNPDVDLRELERRYKQSGTLEDQVAWLRARVRSGDLSPDRVLVAAALGDPAAIQLSGPVPDPGPARGDPVPLCGRVTWIRSVFYLGQASEYLFRLGIASARSVLPLLDPKFGDMDELERLREPHALASRIVSMSEELLVLLSEDRQEEAQSLATEIDAQAQAIDNLAPLHSGAGFADHMAFGSALGAAGALGNAGESLARGEAWFGRKGPDVYHGGQPRNTMAGQQWCYVAYRRAVLAWRIALPGYVRAGEEESEAEERVLSQIRKELIPWLLS